jgi:hypothetical protein
MYSFLLLAALNIDNYNYIGHILPLKHERLSTPHKSSCGLITYEWRGSSPSFDLVDKFCLLAKNKFPAFVKSKGYEVRNKDFRYYASFIPYDFEPRNLNDLKFRFKYRNQVVSGFTYIKERWMFLLSDYKHKEFKVTLVHEMYHALSDFHEVSLQYNGSLKEKLERDEYLAQEFTQSLGLGK